MKTAEECENIEEIRKCIDVIDKSIVDNLSRRSEYVKCVSKFKKTVSEVNAENRVKAMMKLRRCWAEEDGINPDFIELLFTDIVNFFIASEKQEWLKENRNISN
jgi:isochorismate pyruvate lyase